MKKDSQASINHSLSRSEKNSDNFNAYQTEKNINFTEKNFNTRVKRSNDDKTFVEATAEGDYTRCLSIEEIRDIARCGYHNYKTKKTKNSEFQIVESSAQVKETITKFLIKTRAQNRNRSMEAVLTLIIYHAETKHHTSLVVHFDRGLEQVFYADSLMLPISLELQKFLENQKVELTHITEHFIQQKDTYNSAVWALENAADMNRMIDFRQELIWGINQLNQVRGKKFLNEIRLEFAEKLYSDSDWKERHAAVKVNFEEQRKKLFFTSFNENTDEGGTAKKPKTLKNNVKDLLVIFTENFLTAFSKHLAALHIRARNEHLNMQSLKSELITGATGALFGGAISQSLVGNSMGSAPSLVASVRALTGHFLSKNQVAQRVTKYFDGVHKGTLSTILCKAAVNIFSSFEYQFTHLSDKAGYTIAMEKLADDAADRAINYLKHQKSNDIVISNELIEKGILLGPSDNFFQLKPKSLQMQIKGKAFLNDKNEIISTEKLYKKIGLITFDSSHHFKKLYESATHSQKYGYRRLLDWEKDTNGDLNPSLRAEYTEKLFIQPEYEYVLTAAMLPLEIEGILDQIKNRFPSQVSINAHANQKEISKPPIYFELREPVADFSGRVEILKQLHATLISERKMAVVSALSALSIASTSGATSQSTASGSQLSISGLGGVGKTQLALQYAKLYAQEYDNNVLWINAETKENLAFSFSKLARKLQLETKDRYNQDKNPIEIVEAIYEYFSDRKSLFILDNVEDYLEIQDFLPKSMPGNKPTLLITSRYNKWDNVATVFSLSVFTEQETIEFFKKSLGEDSSEKDIKLLNQLLQGLPLALKQAITYINLQRLSMPFSIEDYIDRFKDKAHILLDFNFASHSNDPYLKTVFTTFMVSLDKIRSLPTPGLEAMDLLYVMAYLDPEDIPVELFHNIKKFKVETKSFYMLEINDEGSENTYVSEIMYLLKSYSMINFGTRPGQYNIHRIIQRVLRIHLESNRLRFLEIIGTAQALLKRYGEYKDLNYLHFLLYISEHRDEDAIKAILGYDSIVPFFNYLAEIAEHDITYWHYFLDLAYLKYSKKKFLEFLSDALAYSRKEGYCSLVADILGYLGHQLDQKRLTQDQLQFVMNQLLHSKDEYKLARFSNSREKRMRQEYSFKLIGEFKIRKLGRLFPEFHACSRKKRSLCLTEETQEQLENFKHEAVRLHIEKVNLVTQYVSSGLMGKNILSAVIRGDWDEVAINFELIGGSQILGTLSNHWLTQGKALETEAGLLEKNLGLENKKAWSLLLDKEVCLAGKKLFLGKSLQVASSFVSRGTAIYFAYNLGKQIKAYEAGETELLPEIVSNGVMTGTTLSEITLESLEYLKYIAGVAGRVNPYLEVISVLVWLGAELYEAEEQMQAIQQYIHLSEDEQFIEFVRGFLHFSPSEYLQIKLKNTQLVHHAIDFLKRHSEFTGYIVPDFSPQGTLYADNQVYLDKQREVTPVETSPDAPQEGDLFCLSGNLTQNYQQAYLCQYAMGIQYLQNRTANVTLINLGAGNDTVLAFSDTPNYFFVENGEKRYKGGNKGNVFTLEGNATVGQLRGGKELDVLLLERFSLERDYLLLDQHGYLCGNFYKEINTVPLFCAGNDTKLELVDINQIYGRKQQQEVIYSRQDIQFIDGYGGDTEHSDVFFITQETRKDISVVLRKNTLVIFQSDAPSNLTTDYRIPVNEMGEAKIQLDFNKEIQHRFFFECTLDDILDINLQNNTLEISIWAEQGIDSGNFTLLISDPYFIRDANQSTPATYFEKNSSYFFQNMEIKLVNQDQLFAQELTKGNQTIEEYIDCFSFMANYLDRTMTIQLQDNITLAIGRGNHEIFYADGLFPSHLVGNGGENVYRITTNNGTQFPLAEITLYTSSNTKSDAMEQIDTLDLREGYVQVKKRFPDANFHSSLFADGEDLVLVLSYSVSSQHNTQRYTRMLTICLKAGVDWYQNLDILLEDGIPKHIVTRDGEEWTLIDNPLIFAEHKKVIALTDQDLGEQTEISLLRNSGHYSFFRNDSDLILTNIHTDPLNPCTILAYNYYHKLAMQEKLLSTKLNFFNADFYLKDHQSLMDEAQNFSDFVKQLEKPGNSTQHTPIVFPILRLPDEELPKLRVKRQTPTLMEFSRADGSSQWFLLGSIGMGLTVIMALAGSFYWWDKRRRQQTMPILMGAALLPNISANKQKPSVEKSTALDFFTEFSIKNNCLIAETGIGWLGICSHKQSIIFLKAYKQVASKFYYENYQIKGMHLQLISEGIWEKTNCYDITTNVLAEDIYPFLPPHWQDWYREKNQQQQVWSLWKQRAAMTVTSMLSDGLVLHTPVGDVFKTLGLTPDWQVREDRYLLNRCGWTLEQQLFQANRVSSALCLGSISTELALLHPATHRVYKALTKQEDILKAKFAVRFTIDILQFGFNNLCHLAHVLEYCFPASMSVKNISLGLRMANYFYFLTEDLSYWHLALALFLLPQIPQLLDHLGLPATRGLERFCNKLATCLLSKTLLQKLSADAERQAQADRELSNADVRVTQARQRLSTFVTASTSFFSTPVDSSPANDENKKTNRALQFWN